MRSIREIVSIEEALFNNTLERFYDLGISGLVRENIQNSLVEKLPILDIDILYEKYPLLWELRNCIFDFRSISELDEIIMMEELRC